MVLRKYMTIRYLDPYRVRILGVSVKGSELRM